MEDYFGGADDWHGAGGEIAVERPRVRWKILDAWQAAVAGLRVVDASAMPIITSGNTNAPVMLIAERAARAILG